MWEERSAQAPGGRMAFGKAASSYSPIYFGRGGYPAVISALQHIGISLFLDDLPRFTMIYPLVN